MKLSFLPLVVMVLSSACVVTRDQVYSYSSLDASKGFEALASLEGEWVAHFGEGGDAQEVRSTYELVGNGSVVMERMFAGTPHEMVTMYHRDGDRLAMTHYCALGNQPRMELVGFSSQPETVLSFSFTDASNWTGQGAVMHDMRLVKISDDQFASTWVAWSDGKPEHTANFHFSRVHQLGY